MELPNGSVIESRSSENNTIFWELKRDGVVEKIFTKWRDVYNYIETVMVED